MLPFGGKIIKSKKKLDFREGGGGGGQMPVKFYPSEFGFRIPNIMHNFLPNY